jgi:TolB-like protein/DNA-binding winged helix-turn-helix (wHTH) protein/tetratricopeptide (TPR) repeat protein
MTSALSTPQRQVKLPLHVVDLTADEIRTAEGAHVELRPRSLAVLRLLAENAGRLVTKDELISKVWDDVAVTEDSLTQCVADIRKAIGDEDRRVLRTVPRKGYLLVPSQRPVELAGRAPGLPSLAVMPFLSIGEEDTGHYLLTLGCGVASEIINELARNRDLRLIGRDSSFALANQNLMAQELGEQLGARYLVEGTAQRMDGTLLVDVQLVDARDGSIAWGHRFSAAAAKLPQVQRDIAATIAGSLHAGMRETEKQAILGAAPRDLDVFELTLRGIARKHQFSGEATRAGRADLEEALRRDPNYAPAHAYLAWLNLIDILLRLTGEWDPARLGEVIHRFNRAIELDASLSSAYQGLSQALIYTGDVGQAVAVGRRGVELGPSDADALLFLAVALFESGEITEALELADKAIALNPLRPAYYRFFHGTILWGNERYQEALDECEACLRMTPNFGGADTYRVMCLVGLGRLDEARKLLAQLMASPSGLVLVPPKPPELASRGLAALQAAGWRPTLATDRKAG